MNLILNNNDLLCFAGYGLKCYKCLSLKSWDDCATKHSEEDCPATGPYEMSCMNAYGEGPDQFKAFYKGCYAKAYCDKDFCGNLQLAPDEGNKITKCKFDCCVTDLCNGAKAPLMSTLLLFACVLVAFRRWVVHHSYEVNVTSKFNKNVTIF